MKEELLKGLSEKQIAKIKDCKNNEEILEVANNEGIELTDEQLDAVSGGCGTTTCPSCGSSNVSVSQTRNGSWFNRCNNCNHSWTD